MGNDTAFAGGFHQVGKLEFCSFLYLSEHRAFYSPPPIQIHPLHSWFLQPPPILSNLPTPRSHSASISSQPLVIRGPPPFILGPNHTLGLVLILFSFTFPPRPSFPALWTPLRLVPTSLTTWMKAGGVKKKFLYNCAITPFWLLQNLHKIHENYDFQLRGTVSGRCSKRHVPKTTAIVEFLFWGAAALQSLNETVTWYLTSPKECIYPFLCFEKGLKTFWDCFNNKNSVDQVSAQTKTG